VVQATDPGQADYVGGYAAGALLDGPPERRVLAHPEVRAVPVVGVDEGVEQPAEMVLVEDDDVVEQLPPNGGDEALGDPILPGASAVPTRRGKSPEAAGRPRPRSGSR
jgi:hypothetical protein